MAKKPQQKTKKTEPSWDELQKEKAMSDNENILDLDMNLEDFDDFEPLPAGPYPATVTEAQLKMSDKGNEYYYVVFQVHPDDYPADYAVENAPEGTNLVYARVQKPTAKDRRSITAVKKLYRALGLSLKTATVNPGDWEGKKAKVVVKNSKWNGEPRAEIESVETID